MLIVSSTLLKCSIRIQFLILKDVLERIATFRGSKIRGLGKSPLVQRSRQFCFK